MFGAIKQPNGKYAITELIQFRNSKTFRIKERLKSMGGIWNPTKKWWENIDESHLKDIPACKYLKVRLAPCPDAGHENSYDVFVYECDIKENKVRELTMGDDRIWVNIEEVYGEAQKSV